MKKLLILLSFIAVVFLGVTSVGAQVVPTNSWWSAEPLFEKSPSAPIETIYGVLVHWPQNDARMWAYWDTVGGLSSIEYQTTTNLFVYRAEREKSMQFSEIDLPGWKEFARKLYHTFHPLADGLYADDTVLTFRGTSVTLQGSEYQGRANYVFESERGIVIIFDNNWTGDCPIIGQNLTIARHQKSVICVPVTKVNDKWLMEPLVHKKALERLKNDGATVAGLNGTAVKQ
jgi:hypothetical protein